MEAAGGYKTVAGAYFRGRGACTQHDLKVIVGAKPLTLNVMHIMAPRGQYVNPKMNVCATTLDPKGDLYYFT